MVLQWMRQTKFGRQILIIYAPMRVGSTCASFSIYSRDGWLAGQQAIESTLSLQYQPLKLQLGAEILKKVWLRIRTGAHSSVAVYTEHSVPAKVSNKVWAKQALHRTMLSPKPSSLR